ncbi:hypothetical protein MK489_14970 [Myxococcota bacterium]|nr:hypothetical protein [Myxococcota bacterium]
MDAEQTFLWLQALRLKGRSQGSDLAAALGQSEEEAAVALESLESEGLVIRGDGFYGLSEGGNLLRIAALDAERASVDTELLEGLYAEFLRVDADFKRLVTRVQLGDVSLEELSRDLTEHHELFRALVLRFTNLVPRLERYGPRFDSAFEYLRAGDRRYLASPLVESYHSLWFEFHEELIQMTGRTRAAEEAGSSAT